MRHNTNTVNHIGVADGDADGDVDGHDHGNDPILIIINQLQLSLQY